MIPNPVDFVIKAFSLYVISQNLDVIIIGLLTISLFYVVLKTLQNGFPRQGADPERNKIIRFTLKGLFTAFFLTFFYLIFHEQVQDTLDAISWVFPFETMGDVADRWIDPTWRG